MASEDSSVYNANTNMIVSAKDNLNISTASGIVSIKSGSNIDMRAKSNLLINPEVNMTLTVGGTYTGTIAGTYTEIISGISGIKYNQAATFHYIHDFKEKIDRDHYVDKEGGKVDHTHPVTPARTSGTDPVEAL